MVLLDRDRGSFAENGQGRTRRNWPSRSEGRTTDEKADEAPLLIDAGKATTELEGATSSWRRVRDPKVKAGVTKKRGRRSSRPRGRSPPTPPRSPSPSWPKRRQGPNVLHRPSLLLAGRPDGTGRSHWGKRRRDETLAKAWDFVQAIERRHRHPRQSRLLYEPRVRHLHHRRDDAPRRRRRAGAHRESRQDDRHADAAARGLRRGAFLSSTRSASRRRRTWARPTSRARSTR